MNALYPALLARFHRHLDAAAPEVSALLAGRRSLFLAPHPDDEVLGCGGTIARKVLAGDDVFVVYLTDGRRGVHAPVHEARAIREEEARRAATTLGLGADQIVFLGLEDGRLAEMVTPATARVRELLETLAIHDLFVPYRRDYHPDHLAAWRIGWKAGRGRSAVYEYPVWYGPWLWPHLGWAARLAALSHLADLRRVVRVDITPVAEIKRQALVAYGSQLASLTARRESGPRFLDNFARGSEFFFRGR